ncbi:hypothetical protein OFM13_30060, partial [Escherichia coli]|nr:hypothetical protein [Escherichia coli]
NQAEILAGKGIDDVEKLAAMSIDDLVDALDLTFDEASAILSSAKAVVAAKEAGQQEETRQAEQLPAETGAEKAEAAIEHESGENMSVSEG